MLFCSLLQRTITAVPVTNSADFITACITAAELNDSAAELDGSAAELDGPAAELDESTAELGGPGAELGGLATELDEPAAELDGSAVKSDVPADREPKECGIWSRWRQTQKSRGQRIGETGGANRRSFLI